METPTPQQAHVGETWPRTCAPWLEGENGSHTDSDWQHSPDLKEHNLPSHCLNGPWCQSTSWNKATMGWADGCQNLNADSDASTAVSTEASLTSWNIVWCSERCYKAENDERRERLTELAQSAGATLVLLKKNHKFAAWLAKAQRPPYILLTDWREAKPSLQVAAQEPVHNQPVFTLVVCDEEEKAYERARQWMEELPPRADPVHVIKESGLNIVKQFLANLGEKSPASEGSLRNVSFNDGDDGSSVSTPRSSFLGNRNGLPMTNQFLAQGMTHQQDQDSSLASCSEVDCDDKPILLAAPEDFGITQTSGVDEVHRQVSWLESLQNSALPSEVSDLLSSVLRHRTPTEVAALLHAAQPDIYDD